MRTMLISLVFVGLLSQFAFGDGPEKKSFDRLECEKAYKCLVPEICITGNSPVSGTDEVYKISRGNKIYDDCPAIFRHHGYTKYWLHVSLESLSPNTKSITFTHSDSSGSMKAQFTCTKQQNAAGNWEVNGGYDGEYGPAGARQKMMQITKIKLKEKAGENNGENLKCTFEVRVNKKEKGGIFRDEQGDMVQFKIDSYETSPSGPKPDIIGWLYCDPKQMKFTDVFDKTVVYKAVTYSPEKFYCEDDDIYEMQYRPEPSEPYVPVKLTCSNDMKFIVEYGDPPKSKKVAKVDVRCAAKASFFCEKEVKSKEGAVKPQLKKPERGSNPKEGSMKCDDSVPHLVIMGEDERAFKNAKFECLNMGSTRMWTVNEERLSEEGPVVYCTKKLACPSDRRLKEDAVLFGDLNNDYLPFCFNEEGTLYVSSISPENKVENSYCDNADGEFKYVLASGTHVIDATTTKFICDYPVHDNAEENEKNIDKIVTGSALSAAAVGGGLIVLIAISAIFYMWRTSVARKKARAAQAAAWVKYCMDPNERKAYFAKNKKLKEKETESMSAPGEAWNWNAMLTSFQYTTWAKHSKDDAADANPVRRHEKKPVRFEDNADNAKKSNAYDMGKIEPSRQVRSTPEGNHYTRLSGEMIGQAFSIAYPEKDIEEKRRQDWISDYPQAEHEKRIGRPYVRKNAKKST